MSKFVELFFVSVVMCQNRFFNFWAASKTFTKISLFITQGNDTVVKQQGKFDGHFK